MARSNIHQPKMQNIDMSTALNSEVIEVSDVDMGSMQAIWSGASAVDAVIKLQSSHNKIDWDDVPTASVTLNAASGSISMQFTDVLYPFARFAYAKGGNAAGTLEIRHLWKSRA